MSKGKPVLKRTFPHSSSPHRSGRVAFIFAALLIGFLGWVLYRVVHSSPKPVSKKSNILQTTQRPTFRPPPNKANNPMPSPLQIHPGSLPEKIEIELDSKTFPGRAPRLDQKKPIHLSPSTDLRIDWSKPTIAFVIDDIGHETTHDPVIDQLGGKITYAILPHLKYSKFYGEKSKQTGADVILHLPLESERGIYPGPGLITRFMPEDEIRRMVGENLDSIPNRIGANNHMGSLGTSDVAFMTIILDEFKKRNLFFLDSYTSPKSQVVPTSHQLHLPVLRRDVFLDNVEEPNAIKEEIERAAKLATHSGYAIAIGHYKKYTLEVLAEEIPKLEKRGYQIVKLSDLMKRYN